MIINVKLDLDDDKLRAIRSYIDGHPRKAKATRKEVNILVSRWLDQVIAEAPQKGS